MTTDENMATVRRFFDEFQNEQRVELATELFAPTAYVNGHPIDLVTYIQHQAARPFDFQITINELIATGDTVVARTSARGPHVGTWFGVHATHQEATMWAIDIFHLTNGKIVEQWHVADRLGTLLELGAFPRSDG